MKVHVLQHVCFEGLGSIQQWLDKRSAEISFTPFFESSHLPAPDDPDLVIVMGGPMSVHDVREYPWLLAETQFLAQRVRSDLPTLGICLGAQLIASALGFSVYANPVKEIGWFDITASSVHGCGHFAFPPVQKVFHWHGESFDLPVDATLLASSEACRNQAFQFGNNVIAMQFHLETTADSAESIINHCRDELVPGPFIQTAEEMLSMPDSGYDAVNRLMDDLLDYITQF